MYCCRHYVTATSPEVSFVRISSEPSFGQLQIEAQRRLRMNTNILRTLALLTLGTLSINAQLSRGVVAKVPFDFVAGYKSFPAGEYQLVEGPATTTITIRSRNGKTGAIVMFQRTESLQVHPKSTLVFNRYGAQYFLRQVWVEGDTSSAQLLKTPAESEAEARMPAVTKTVTGS
jgi:hypothetical protein